MKIAKLTQLHENTKYLNNQGEITFIGVDYDEDVAYLMFMQNNETIVIAEAELASYEIQTTVTEERINTEALYKVRYLVEDTKFGSMVKHKEFRDPKTACNFHTRLNSSVETDGDHSIVFDNFGLLCFHSRSIKSVEPLIQKSTQIIKTEYVSPCTQ